MSASRSISVLDPQLAAEPRWSCEGLFSSTDTDRLWVKLLWDQPAAERMSARFLGLEAETLPDWIDASKALRLMLLCAVELAAAEGLIGADFCELPSSDISPKASSFQRARFISSRAPGEPMDARLAQLLACWGRRSGAALVCEMPLDASSMSSPAWASFGDRLLAFGAFQELCAPRSALSSKSPLALDPDSPQMGRFDSSDRPFFWDLSLAAVDLGAPIRLALARQSWLGLGALAPSAIFSRLGELAASSPAIWTPAPHEAPSGQAAQAAGSIFSARRERALLEASLPSAARSAARKPSL